MNKTIINTLISTVFVASLGFATTSIAATDFYQQALRQHVLEAQQKLKQAKAATGTEQQKLLGEHKQMLRDSMETCRKMKPKAGMTEQERNAWFAEHQKIMDQIMDQMMEEHKIIMTSAPCDMNNMNKK